MKKVFVLTLALALMGGVAYANFCARDVVPATTLLIPYVAVDVDNNYAPLSTGMTTITGITNTSSAAQIVHFTCWDVLSTPVVDFDEILSGYDVLQINWRDLLTGSFNLFDTDDTVFAANGMVFTPTEWGPDGRDNPVAASRLQTAAQRDTVSCGRSVPPYGSRPDLVGLITGNLFGALGHYPHNECGGQLKTMTLFSETFPASPVWFYVTADVVIHCNLLFPTSAGYFTDEAALPNGKMANVLMGDVIYLDATHNYSDSFPAVHIEAASDMTRAQVFPFYGDLTNEQTYREPLATGFGFRYANDTNISTNVILWKNFHEIVGRNLDTVSDCGSYLYYAWDMDERSLTRQPGSISGSNPGLEPNQFPFETQKVPVSQSYFDLPAGFGWMLLLLPPAYLNAPGNSFTDPTPGAGESQQGAYTNLRTASKSGYMGWAAVQFNYGSYSTAVEATTMSNYHCLPGQVLPFLGPNAAGAASTFTFNPTPVPAP